MAEVGSATIRIPSPDAFFRALAGPGGGLMKAMMAVGFKVEARAKMYTSGVMVGVVTGRLSGGITTVPAVINGTPAVLVGTNTSYAIYVHEGTKAHWPPRDPIAKWLAFKGGNPRDAYRVQRAIARRGTAPRPFLSTALRDVLASG